MIRGFAAAQEARLKAHEAYLRTAEGLTRAMADTLALQASLVAALGGSGIDEPVSGDLTPTTDPPPSRGRG